MLDFFLLRHLGNSLVCDEYRLVSMFLPDQKDSEAYPQLHTIYKNKLKSLKTFLSLLLTVDLAYGSITYLQ